MRKVGIVTDSNAYLPPEFLAEFPVQVIPHRIKLGSSYIEEDESFSAEEMFSRMQGLSPTDADRLPEVQSADLNTILDCYHTLGNQVTDIVSIHMSSHLSPILEQARHAAEMLKGRLTIRVIDSFSATYGLGLLVQKAARAAASGTSLNEIVRIINGSVPHIYYTGFAESLNYLERSAHLSASQSLLGTLLGIKAMLMMEEGKLIPLEKVQTREDAVQKLYDFVAEFATVQEVGIVQHGYTEAQDALIARLAEDNRLCNIPINCIPYPPSLGAHIGPNAIGVVVYEGDL